MSATAFAANPFEIVPTTNGLMMQLEIFSKLEFMKDRDNRKGVKPLRVMNWRLLFGKAMANQSKVTPAQKSNN